MKTDNQPPLAVPPATIRRVAFLGTPVEAATVLEHLHRSPIEVVQVITRPDRRRGRGSSLMASPVKRTATELGLPVGDDLSALDAAQIDLAVVVAYGRIIPRPFLERHPMVNIHFSLLPRWRGAAPVERAILAGDERTGVSIMVVDEALDTGAVYAVEATPIGPDETAAALRERLTLRGAELLVDQLVGGLGDPTPQRGEEVYAAKLGSEEARLDFEQPADQIHRRVRVGRAWTTFRNKRLGVEEVGLITGTDTDTRTLEDSAPGSLNGTTVAAGVGTLRLVTVKPEGKRSMTADDWVNGQRVQPGETLG